MSGTAQVLIEKMLQGPDSVSLSETMVEDLCQRRAWSVCLAVTHTQSHSGEVQEEDRQPEVPGSRPESP